MNDRIKILRRYCTRSRDSPFHLNGRRFCLPFSFPRENPSPSLSLFLIPFPVAPKSSSKHNNRVWRGSGVQRRCWKVWLALQWMEERVHVPWTRREIGFRGWYSVYIFSGTPIRNFFNYNYPFSSLFLSSLSLDIATKVDKLASWRGQIYIYERNKVNRVFIIVSLLLFYFNARSLDLILRIIVFLSCCRCIVYISPTCPPTIPGDEKLGRKCLYPIEIIITTSEVRCNVTKRDSFRIRFDL